MNAYFFIIIMSSLLLAGGILFFSYKALRDAPLCTAQPKEHMLIWAFGSWPENLENIPELIKLWNLKHGHELLVKEGEDIHQVLNKITQLWEKQDGQKDGKSDESNENR